MNSIQHEVAPVRRSKQPTISRKKKVVTVAAIVGTLSLPLAAWAAVQIFGFGTFESQAATVSNLEVDATTAKLTTKLMPGRTVGAQAAVTNNNDFPVKITGVLVRHQGLEVSPAASEAACRASVHLEGTAATWPGTGGGNASLQTVTPITIPANSTRTVIVPASVRQDAAAEVLCGVKADFAVRGENAS